MSYYAVRYDDSLEHHGILGQKWGKRNGPPYPLDESDHSAAEKKAEKNKSGAIDKDSPVIASKKLQLTDQQKKYVKYGAIASAVALTAIGGYALYKTGNLQKIGEKVIGKGIMANSDPVIKDALKKCNPLYSISPLKANNCGNSVLAFEKRVRGDDVIARNNTIGMTQKAMIAMFTGINNDTIVKPKMTVNDNPTLSQLLNPFAMVKRGKQVETDIKNAILNAYSDDARGCVFVPAMTGSHWISWIKKGDTVEILNPQNRRLNLVKKFFPYYVNHGIPDADITSFRTDNLAFSNLINAVVGTSGDISEIFDTMKYV